MDEATRTGGPAVEHKRGLEEIREDIAQTREELGETVEALASKTDVKGQAKAKVDDTKQRASAKVHLLRERVGSAAGDAQAHKPSSARDGVDKLKRAAAANPVASRVIGAFVAGVLIGALVAR